VLLSTKFPSGNEALRCKALGSSNLYSFNIKKNTILNQDRQYDWPEYFIVLILTNATLLNQLDFILNQYSYWLFNLMEKVVPNYSFLFSFQICGLFCQIFVHLVFFKFDINKVKSLDIAQIAYHDSRVHIFVFCTM
jgi:hypothetical protein